MQNEICSTKRCRWFAVIFPGGTVPTRFLLRLDMHITIWPELRRCTHTAQ